MNPLKTNDIKCSNSSAAVTNRAANSLEEGEEEIGHGGAESRERGRALLIVDEGESQQESFHKKKTSVTFISKQDITKLLCFL